MERAGFRPLPSLHNFLQTAKWLLAPMSSVTPSNHLGKGILENLGEGLWWSWLLGPLCPVSPPGASTLHAHCLGHLPRPLHSQRPRGTHISCMSSSEGFNSSLCPPHPRCPCHRVGRHSLPREGWDPAQSHAAVFLPNTWVSGAPGQVSVLQPHSPPLGSAG